jgi:hypothetical protein
MTTALDLGPLVAASEDYRAALARLDDATADAAAAWARLPDALSSPGITLGLSNLVIPARTLASSLLASADAVHSALASDAETLRWLEWQAAAAADDASWSIRADDTVTSCAAAIAAVTGGETGSVALPHPSIPRTLRSAPQRSTSVTFGPAAPGLPAALDFLTVARAVGSGLAAGTEAAGSAIASGAGAAAVGVGATVAGVLGVAGLVLSMGGSTDTAAQERARATGAAGSPARASAPFDPEYPNHKKRFGKHGDPNKVTDYQPCTKAAHGDGCIEFRPLGDKPGSRPFTGDKVSGEELPGDMPGTGKDWTREPTRNGKGWIYRSPDGWSVRVMRPGWNARYPYGDVVFENPARQPVDLQMKTHTGDDMTHIVRNDDGSFPIPEGWMK